LNSGTGSRQPIVDENSARQNDALNSLMNLQSCGITDEEILNIYTILIGSKML